MRNLLTLFNEWKSYIKTVFNLVKNVETFDDVKRLPNKIIYNYEFIKMDGKK